MKYFILIAGTCFLFGACKKSSSGPSNTDLLTSQTWVYDNGGADLNADGTIDLNFSAVIPACSLDNSAKFNSNGTGVGSENTMVCAGAAPTSAFNWTFSNNETVLNISGNVITGLSGAFKIMTLTSTSLGLSKDTTVTGLGPATAIFFLKH
jgi:hypothetical protein